MSKVLQATYRDGNLVLDEKLDAELEGKKLFLILVDESAQLQDGETPLTQAEILQRIEQRRSFSPSHHDLPDMLTLLQEDRAR